MKIFLLKPSKWEICLWKKIFQWKIGTRLIYQINKITNFLFNRLILQQHDNSVYFVRFLDLHQKYILSAVHFKYGNIHGMQICSKHQAWCFNAYSVTHGALFNICDVLVGFGKLKTNKQKQFVYWINAYVWVIVHNTTIKPFVHIKNDK